ncbi:MAG: hypothetical protein HXY24_11520 [Rubrivivax sp.]|nr:hypothetical protein [Rubrivivax sp.]
MEVLVSLVSMAIGFVIILGLHYSSLKVESGDNRRTVAIEVARSVMERCRSQDCPHGSDCEALFPTLTSDPNLVKLPSGRTCTITQQVSGFDDWRRDLTVTVRWPERFKRLGGGATATNLTQDVRLSTVYIDH